MPMPFDAIYENGVPKEWEAAKHDDISLQEIRNALSSIPGSLAEAIIASREERRLAGYFVETSLPSPINLYTGFVGQGFGPAAELPLGAIHLKTHLPWANGSVETPLRRPASRPNSRLTVASQN